MVDLSGKNIVLGVTGGIAAYKAAELCRLLVKAGATVRVVMTDAATHFITPLTMQTLSGAPVALNLFDADQEARIGHIRLGDEADLIVIAPATANSIARLAAGGADDLLSAVVLASRAPVLLAPAMNVNMWQNPLTQQNLGRLLELGRFQTVGPDAGALACGWVGEGRLIEPTEIAAAARRMLTPQDLAGIHVVVTAGPTFEPIDDVRFIGNRSSGKMGFAIAAAAARRGAQVTLIAGPVALPTPPGAPLQLASPRAGAAGSVSGAIVRHDVESAAELRTALLAALPAAEVLVMTAAVADFRAANRVTGKLSRRAAGGANQGPGGSAGINLPLLANPDLLAEVSRGRRAGRPMLVGFAAEVGVSDPGELTRRATAKLVEKNCDVVIANDVGDAGIGFGSDENAVTLVYADGGSESLPRAPKSELAESIWDRLISRFPALGEGTTTGTDTRSAAGRPLPDSRTRAADGGAPAGRREEGGGSQRRSGVVRPPTLRSGSRSRRHRA